MAQFPCLPLWTDAWLADTVHLTREQRGTYLDLLILMWRTPRCRVPSDRQWLGNHLRMTAIEVDKLLWPIITEFCRWDGNWITQKRLQKEFDRSNSYRERMSDLRKRRQNKRNDTNTARTTSDVASPSTSPKHLRSSFFNSLEEKATAQKPEQDKSARSLATAPDEGALTRSPETESAEVTLAEVRKRMGWK